MIHPANGKWFPAGWKEGLMSQSQSPEPRIILLSRYAVLEGAAMLKDKAT